MSKKNIHIDELAKKAYDGFEVAPISDNWEKISSALSGKDISMNELSKKAYDGFGIPPMPKNWDAISAALDGDDKKGGFIPWFKITASALLIISLFALGSQFINTNKNDIVKNENNLHNQNTRGHDPLHQNADNDNAKEIPLTPSIHNADDINTDNSNADKINNNISHNRNTRGHDPLYQNADNDNAEEIPLTPSPRRGGIHDADDVNTDNSNADKINNNISHNRDTRNHNPLHPDTDNNNSEYISLGQINLNPNKGITPLNTKGTREIKNALKQIPNIENPYKIKPKLTPYISLGINYGMVNNAKTFTNTNVSENDNKSTALPNIDFKLGVKYGKWKIYSGVSSNSFSYSTNMNHLIEIYDSFPDIDQFGDTIGWFPKNFRDSAKMTQYVNNMHFVTIPVGIKYTINLDATHRNKIALGLATEIAIPTSFTAFGTDNKGYLLKLNKDNLKKFSPIFNINIEYNRAINNRIGVYLGLEHKFSATNIYSNLTPYNEKLRKTMISTGLEIKF